MSQTYYAILTAIGEAKLANAAALNTTLKLAKMAVGDGGGVVPTPNRSQTALVGEWYRAGLNTLAVDPNNTSQIIAELVIPEATGGSWIREMGLIDADGNLIAVANTPPSYKPQLAEGSGRTQVLRMVLVVSSTSAVELKIDPSVVLATRQYVDDAITVAVNRLDNKQSVRVATTANLTLSGTPTVDGIALAVSDRILVKNQDTASQNGLYLVAAGTWNRALDADASSEVTPGLTVYVEQGTAQADTIWKLVTDAPITLGNTALAFADITSGYAPLRSPAFTDKPTAPTASRFDSSKQLANTEALKQRGLEFATVKDVTAAGTVLLSEDAGAVIRVNLAASGALILPALASLPIAAAMLIKNISDATSVTITPAGDATLPRPLKLAPLTSVLLIARPGATSWLVVGGAAEVFDDLSAGVAGQVGLRNWIINGGFDVWQRGTSFSATAAYTADRFAMFMVGSGMTVSQQEFAIGQTDVPGARYFMRSVVSSVAGANNYADIHHRIEDVRRLAGKVVTVSLYARADAAKNIAVDLSQVFGSGANVDGIGAQKFAVTTAWQRYTATIRLPGIAGKSPTAASNTTLRIWFDAGATYDAFNGGLGQQSGTFDIANVQLEEGWLATPFEFRPLSLEISLCQRYFESGFFQSSFWSGASGQSSLSTVPFKTNKRVTPTIAASGTSLSNASAAVLQNVDVGKFTAGATSNAVSQVNVSFAWAADAEL